MAAAQGSKWLVQLNHSEYSSDLACSDCYLFQNSEISFCDVHYPEDESHKAAMETWLEGQTE